MAFNMVISSAYSMSLPAGTPVAISSDIMVAPARAGVLVTPARPFSTVDLARFALSLSGERIDAGRRSRRQPPQPARSAGTQTRTIKP